MDEPDRYRSPLTVLDAQLDLLDWWGSARGERWRRETTQRMAAAGAPVWVREVAVGTIPAMLNGWTCWIGGEAALAIGHAAESIPPPDGAIGPGMIPHPAGMMWLSGDPVDLGAIAAGETAWVRVVSWAPMLIDTTEGRMPAVEVVVWIEDGPQVRPVPVGALPLSADAAAMLDDPGDATATLDMADVWASDGAEADVYRWICAAWVMCAQVLPSTVVSAPRAQRRRAARVMPVMPPEWGDVHVTTLRVAEHGADHGESGGVRYSHRWVVRGHWRWQPCGEGRRDRRLTWIAPHVKGPDGAPLVEVDQVAKLVR